MVDLPVTEADVVSVKSDFSPVLDAWNGAFLWVQAHEAHATVNVGSGWIVVGNKQGHGYFVLKQTTENHVRIAPSTKIL